MQKFHLEYGKKFKYKIIRETIHAKGIDIGIYTSDFENEYILLTDIAKGLYMLIHHNNKTTKKYHIYRYDWILNMIK